MKLNTVSTLIALTGIATAIPQKSTENSMTSTAQEKASPAPLQRRGSFLRSSYLISLTKEQQEEYCELPRHEQRERRRKALNLRRVKRREVDAKGSVEKRGYLSDHWSDEFSDDDCLIILARKNRKP